MASHYNPSRRSIHFSNSLLFVYVIVPFVKLLAIGKRSQRESNYLKYKEIKVQQLIQNTKCKKIEEYFKLKIK